MDARYVFRYLRKNTETMLQVLEHLGDEVLRFAEKAVENGASMISYADSTGGLNILGPKNMELVTNAFTYPFLKKAQKVVEGKAQIILCPKTTFALLGTEKMVWKDVPIAQPMKYVEACMSVKDEAIIVGQSCIKDSDLVLKRCVKAVELV
jgi:uroporphyrinogen-III decarboxylase